MRFILRIRTIRAALALATTAVLTFTSATPATSAEIPPRSAVSIASSAPTDPNATFTVEQFIQGIVFANGPVAESLDRVVSYPAGLTAEQLSIVQDVERRITNSMVVADGPALEGAIPGIVSGDPYLVESSLKIFSTSFKTALDREYPGASDTLIITPRCGAIAICVAVSVAAVALGAAIAAVLFNVAGAVNMIYNQNGLWNQNGVFNGKKAPRASNPTELVENYPSLSASEEVRLITVALRSGR